MDDDEKVPGFLQKPQELSGGRLSANPNPQPRSSHLSRRPSPYSPDQNHPTDDTKKLSVFQQKNPTLNDNSDVISFPVPQTGDNRPIPNKEIVSPSPLDDLDDDEEGCDEEWMKHFLLIRCILIVCGRWPITYKRETNKKGYRFRFSWNCVGFGFYAFNSLVAVCSFVVCVFNVVQILMKEKGSSTQRTKTEIIEQALLERHTSFVIVFLGTCGMNVWTSFFILKKSEDTAVTFTRWTHFLHESKLSTGGFATYSYTLPAFINYFVCMITLFTLMQFEVGATMIGGPTVTSILLIRQFLSKNYLEENFSHTTLHLVMHQMGICIWGYTVFVSNSNMFFFVWLLKSIENAFFCWNSRLVRVLQASSEKHPESESNKSQIDPMAISRDRTSYHLLYHDHIGLVRMLNWFNNMYSYILEPFLLFKIVKIVYQFYLAALVLEDNGKPLNRDSLGKYFVRKRDYIPQLVMMAENCILISIVLYACAWLEDVTYDSYDDLRKQSLLKETKSEKESFFYLSMFQSYTSTTRMSVYAGQFFCLDRYSVLHVLSAIMSNFLVVYQFKPLFDMDTREFEDLRNIVGTFLTEFEGLPANHLVPISDEERNQANP